MRGGVPRGADASPGVGEGIFFTQQARAPRDVGGHTLALDFTIADYTPKQKSAKGKGEGKGEGKGKGEGEGGEGKHGPYDVTLRLKGVGVAAMNQGASPVVGVSKVSARGPFRTSLSLSLSLLCMRACSEFPLTFPRNPPSMIDRMTESHVKTITHTHTLLYMHMACLDLWFAWDVRVGGSLPSQPHDSDCGD